MTLCGLYSMSCSIVCCSMLACLPAAAAAAVARRVWSVWSVACVVNQRVSNAAHCALVGPFTLWLQFHTHTHKLNPSYITLASTPVLSSTMRQLFESAFVLHTRTHKLIPIYVRIHTYAMRWANAQACSSGDDDARYDAGHVTSRHHHHHNDHSL